MGGEGREAHPIEVGEELLAFKAEIPVAAAAAMLEVKMTETLCICFSMKIKKNQPGLSRTE